MQAIPKRREDDVLRFRPLAPEDDPASPPADGFDGLLLPEINSLYAVGFASSARCVNRALRLRYEVFNVELGEGLMTSQATGLDRDVFDDQMTHLILLERATGEVVGTYRLQTALRGLAGKGIYSADEYDFAALEPYLPEAIECGRACLAVDHRTFAAMTLLWKGILAFASLKNCRWLFGCSSLTTLNPDDGWRALKTLRARGYLHEKLFLPAREDFSCGSPSREFDASLGPAIPLPKLFNAYMRLGGWAISEPALDRAFGTVDFLILLNARETRLGTISLDSVTRRLLAPAKSAVSALWRGSEKR
jgi:putative hemolysin